MADPICIVLHPLCAGQLESIRPLQAGDGDQIGDREAITEEVGTTIFQSPLDLCHHSDEVVLRCGNRGGGFAVNLRQAAVKADCIERRVQLV